MVAVPSASRSSGRGGAYVVEVPWAALNAPGPVSVHATGPVELETLAVTETGWPPAATDEADAATVNVTVGGGVVPPPPPPPPPPQPASAVTHQASQTRPTRHNGPRLDALFIESTSLWTVTRP